MKIAMAGGINGCRGIGVHRRHCRQAVWGRLPPLRPLVHENEAKYVPVFH